MRARGLKLLRMGCRLRYPLSRPMRARGLKRNRDQCQYKSRLSRPMRARGLKLRVDDKRRWVIDVAPHAGAWVETIRRSCP